MYELAQAQSMYPTLIESLVLKSKLKFVESKIDESDMILNQALLLAEEKNLIVLRKHVEREIRNMVKALREMKGIVDAVNITDRITQSGIMEYLSMVLQNIYQE